MMTHALWTSTKKIIHGCFGAVLRGPKEALMYFGNLNGERWHRKDIANTSSQKVVDWLRSKRDETGCSYLFMHDNAPVHRAPPARCYLEAHGIELMLWPAYSPDLNPIEHVWSMMRCYIQNKYPEFERDMQRNRAEVRTIVREAWYHCTCEEKLLRLISRMNKRCEEVTRVEGGPTSY